jgi:hypothetical protein
MPRSKQRGIVSKVRRLEPHRPLPDGAVNRCLVPANSFAEYVPEPNPETEKKDVVWFGLNDDRLLFAFAGIWTEFRDDRGCVYRKPYAS